MERMAEAVPDSDDQVLQNFLTHSSWDHRAVMDRVAGKADTLLGADRGVGLYIDESAFQKKGDKSVGVARQWNGRLGKQDNCQVGVFGALGRGDRVSLIDARLYLPKEWTEDPRRCEHAAVPRAEQVHRTKLELAQEIVRHARQSGVRFEWVGMDGLYGQSLELLESLQTQGETFLAEIHSDRQVYLSDPAPYLPAQEPGRGRPRLRYHSDAQAVEVRKWVKQQPASAWRKKTLRNTTKGDLIVEVLHRRVWLWGQARSERALLAFDRATGSRFARHPQILLEQRSRADECQNAHPDASATFLDRAGFPGREEPYWHGAVSSPTVAVMASAYGLGDDGHAVHAASAARSH